MKDKLAQDPLKDQEVFNGLKNLITYILTIILIRVKPLPKELLILAMFTDIAQQI